MPKKRSDRPTDAELEILRVLWRDGPSTVREVHQRLKKGRTTAYTTVLTQLQIMYKKGFVRRNEKGQSHVYRAAKGQEQTERQVVSSIIERTFGGDARNLVLHALAIKRAPSDEIERVRKFFDRPSRSRR